MRFFLVLACLCSGFAFAEEDLQRELEQAQENMQKAQENAQNMLRQLQEKTGGALGNEKLAVVREKVMKLANNPDFLTAAGELFTHPKRSKVLVINLIFFVFMIILKAWRQSKASNWFVKMIVGFSFTIITWAGMVYFIPSFVFGPVYQVFLGSIWKAFAG